jgi:hypothetical protein
MNKYSCRQHAKDAAWKIYGWSVADIGYVMKNPRMEVGVPDAYSCRISIGACRLGSREHTRRRVQITYTSWLGNVRVKRLSQWSARGDCTWDDLTLF